MTQALPEKSEQAGDVAHLGLRQKLYLYLAGVFLTALLVGDIIGSKLFVVDFASWGVPFHATLSVGAMWFPITFVLTDVLNEFYGPRGARQVTFLGFWMALFAFCAIFIARLIPAASFSPIPQPMFDQVFGGANRIFVASLIAYLCGQLLDIKIFSVLKRRTGPRHIWLRATGSTLISQLIDTVLVANIAFFGLLPSGELPGMIVSSYVVKVGAAVLLTPVIYALHAFIHRRFGLATA